MPLVAVVTLIGVALTVLALAGYLIQVALILRHVNFTLGTIIAGVRSIANQTEPLGPIIDEINRDLADVRSSLDGLLARKGVSTQRSPGLASSTGAGAAPLGAAAMGATSMGALGTAPPSGVPTQDTTPAEETTPQAVPTHSGAPSKGRARAARR